MLIGDCLTALRLPNSSEIEKPDIRRLPPGGIPGGFRCKAIGQADDLGDYLTDGSAIRDEATGFARSYLVYQNGELVAYFSLQADAIKLEPDEQDKKVPYESAPALKLTRIGVHFDLAGQGIGSKVLELVLATALDLSQSIGIRYLTLDSVADKVLWYEKRGFVRNRIVGQPTTEADTNSGECSMRRDLGPIHIRPVVATSPVRSLHVEADPEFEALG